MTRQDIEKIITEYIKPIFGFTLKKCKNIQDAEDLSQEIIMRAFRALLIKDDVADVGKFIWTIAHNSLSNYYRDSAKSIVGVSLEEVSELIADPFSIVILASKKIQSQLLAIGDKIKAYELQFLFHSDEWFLLHCITTLLKNGKLQMPTENQRKSLTTLIMPN